MTAEIKANCGNCGKDFSVTASGPVAHLTCPHCGHELLEAAQTATDLADQGDPLDLVE